MGGRLYQLSFSHVRGENCVQRRSQEEPDCAILLGMETFFFLPVDCVSEESVLVIQHAPDTSKKQGFGTIGVSFAVANKQKI